jgi:FkbM family methyltransferase
VVIQAGGCSGLWPLTLARYFSWVYTFEPAQSNFEVLRQNVAGVANISAFDHALSDTRQRVGLTREKPQAGMWHVEGSGDIQAIALDEFLGDVVVDALVLDVEGSELAAWRGAERLIMAHQPLLWFEWGHNTEALEAWLAAHGYTPPIGGIGRDKFSLPFYKAK